MFTVSTVVRQKEVLKWRSCIGLPPSQTSTTFCEKKGLIGLQLCKITSKDKVKRVKWALQQAATLHMVFRP